MRQQSGGLVKRLRRRPLTAETGVRFPYELLTLIWYGLLGMDGNARVPRHASQNPIAQSIFNEFWLVAVRVLISFKFRSNQNPVKQMFDGI